MQVLVFNLIPDCRAKLSSVNEIREMFIFERLQVSYQINDSFFIVLPSLFYMPIRAVIVAGEDAYIWRLTTSVMIH